MLVYFNLIQLSWFMWFVLVIRTGITLHHRGSHWVSPFPPPPQNSNNEKKSKRAVDDGKRKRQERVV